jgi:hypothetical protein
MAFLDILSAGGITGLVGNLISTVFQFINQKQKNKHDLAMKRLDMEAMEREAKMNIQITEAKIQGDIQVAEMNAFSETIKQNAVDKLNGDVLGKMFDSKWTMPFGVLIAFLFGLVDFLKAAIRPGITLYMTIAVTWVYFKSLAIIQQDGFNYDTSLELFYTITDAILYVFITVTLWWFGDRRVAKVMNRSNGWKK